MECTHIGCDRSSDQRERRIVHYRIFDCVYRHTLYFCPHHFDWIFCCEIFWNASCRLSVVANVHVCECLAVKWSHVWAKFMVPVSAWNPSSIVQSGLLTSNYGSNHSLVHIDLMDLGARYITLLSAKWSLPRHKYKHKLNHFVHGKGYAPMTCPIIATMAGRKALRFYEAIVSWPYFKINYDSLAIRL